MQRVGHGETTAEQLEESYRAAGERCRRAVLNRLPEGWFRPGRRVLDFGAGAGRVLRQFRPEAEAGAEFWGCDVDEASVFWANRNLPDATFFANDERPPLDVPDQHFDLVYAMSVFTHITLDWADWLIEMHRIMRPNGILIATFLGQSMFEKLLGDPYDEDEVGMLILKPGASWDEGGPTVFHSKWWIETHWAPAFALLEVTDNAMARQEGMQQGHGIALGRRTARRPDRDALLSLDLDDPRETRALANNVERLGREVEYLRRGGETMEQTILRARLDALEEELQRRAALLADVERSLSWRITKPLRWTKGALARR